MHSYLFTHKRSLNNEQFYNENMYNGFPNMEAFLPGTNLFKSIKNCEIRLLEEISKWNISNGCKIRMITNEKQM